MLLSEQYWVKSIKNNLDLLKVKPDIKPIFKAYYDLIKEANVCDFDDILVLALTAIRKGIVKPLDATHILVDEFQDTSNIQYDFLDEHIKRGVEVIAVGDDDQSIYAFRDSNGYDGIVKFINSTNANLIKLPTNYRSNSEIVSAASNLVTNNKDRIPKLIQSNRGPGGSIKASLFDDIDSELDWLTTLIRNDQSTTQYSDWAILHRNQISIRATENALNDAKIPYRLMVSMPNILDEPQVAPVIAFMLSLYGTDVGLSSVVEHLGAKSNCISKVHKTFNANIYDLSDKDILSLDLEKGSEQAYIWLINQLSEKSNYLNDITKLIEVTFRSFKSIPWLKKNDVRGKTLDFACKKLSKIEGGLQKRINIIKNIHGNETSEIHETLNEVKIFTIHGSKGLQFPNIIIPFCNEITLDLDDTKKKLTNSEVEKRKYFEEERRIFFVGMTRAENHLFMTGNINRPSQFLTDTKITINYIKNK